MSRNISKRIELNDLEAKTLKMKADQCHLSESDYLRELIMNSQPVEAPPRQFYVQMEKSFFSKERFNVVCCKRGNVFVNNAQEIIYRVAVSINRRFLQVPLLCFIADLSKNIFVHKNLLESSVYRDNYPSGGALAS